MIRVAGVTHRFGEKTVLNDVSLHVSACETVAIMGGSGEGKTTLLRCMAGLLRPTEGVVELFGVDICTAPERKLEEIRRRVGVVFQGAALFDYLNVADNVSFGVVRRGRLNGEEIAELVAKKLKLVGLEGTERLMPSELSGGMRKRVGLARALAADPEILFFDEPTSGLDPVTAYSIDSLIREIGKELFTTSVVVSHDLHSVMRVADRVVFMFEGEVLADTTPEEFHRSDDPRIREAIEKAEDEALAVSDATP